MTGIQQEHKWRRQVAQEENNRLSLLTGPGLALVVTGIVVGALLASAASAALGRWFVPGTWDADEALRFDPFTLKTRAVKNASPKSTARNAGTSVETSGDLGGVLVEESLVVASPPPPPPTNYVPLPRIPYRPPLRSPYRPPL